MLLVALLAAHAHVGDLIDTLDAAALPGGAAVFGTFGLMLPAGDSFDWVCHEVVTVDGALTSPDYAVRDGRITSWLADLNLARDGVGVWTSADGCGWAPATGVDGRIVAEVSHAADGSTWLATADAADNHLFRALDGLAYAPVHAVDGRLLSVRANGPSIWAISAESDTSLTVWHSPDGLTFTGHPLVVPAGLTAPVRARIGAVHPTDPDQAWIVVDPIGTDRVLHATNAGAVTTQLWDAPDRVTDLDRAPDGTLYAVLNDRRVWRSAKGQAFEDLTDLPDGSGLDASTGTLWVANRTFVNELLLTRSDDGSTPSRSFRPTDIRGPLQCPSDSEAARMCDPLWPVLEPRLRPVDTSDTAGPPPPPDTDDTGTPPAVDRTCGCVKLGVAPGSSMAAAAMALLLARRRTRTAGR
jgi:hypothetical protein